jgi:glutamine amidotransferase
VVRFTDPAYKVPHMGWNNLIINREDPLTAGITPEDYVYFVHSYYAVPRDFNDVAAYAQYGVRVPAVVHRDNVIGMQFHPEKSAAVGQRLLTNFKEFIQ